MTAEERAAAAAIARTAEILELDIKTSTLSELAAWCRSLGLSEGGDRAALGSRLRDYFKLAGVPAAGGEAAAAVEGAPIPKVITIESARSTEYFTIDTVNEDYARLKGEVRITLKDGDAIHRITAWEILYNRTRNLMSASGGVEYIKESGDTIETFRGESITVDLDNWSSIFMDGVSERAITGEETTYRFSGTIISRSAEEATVLSHAQISNASNTDALWSISASKIWLLPGSDFALLNGVLKVGEIPVLYIPAFFFPGDELIFHPVLGYRSREGNFIQTTTYILGRPKASASTENSLTKILGNSKDMEKVRHGVFLRSTGKKSRDPNDTRLSVLLDYYANLGGYVGTELALPKKGILGEYNLSFGMGFTRDIMQIPDNNNIYTPFPTFDGTSNWNTSRIFDWDAPFRIRMTNTGSLGGKYGSFSWSLPYYSDPYVDRDFLDRSEDMDYVKMLKQGGATLEGETDTLTKNVRSSYEWSLRGSPTISLPKLSPYITGLSISNITSFITFNNRTSTKFNNYTQQIMTELNGRRGENRLTALNIISPKQQFFYPEKFTIYSLTAQISGTPLSLGGSKPSATAPPANTGANAGTVPEPAPQDPFKGFGVPNSPWKTVEDGDTNSKTKDPAELPPPILSQRFDLPLAGGPRFSIGYQLSPTSVMELQFPTSRTNWPEVEDIDWTEASSILTQVKLNSASTTFTLSDTNSIISSSFVFSGSASWQDYTYINEDVEEYKTEDQVNAAKIRAMGQTSFTSSWASTITLKPFYLSPVWSSTSFEYSLRGLLAKSELKTDTLPAGVIATPDDKYWDILYGKWDKENIDSHQAKANIQALIMNKSQTLSLTADIPPEDSTITGSAVMRIWKSETSFNTRVRAKTEAEKAKEEGRPAEVVDTKNDTVTFEELFKDPFIEPLRFTETLRFTGSLIFTQNVDYDPEKEEFTNVKSTLSAYGFSASFTAAYSPTYSLESADGGWVWKTSPDSSLNPREFSLGYNHTFRKNDLWNKRISFSVIPSTTFTFNLQQFTSSSFNFTLNFTLGISKFVDITMGTSSVNGSIYRYFRDTALFDVPDDLPRIGEENLFIDLINSFRFDDDSLRRASGFKLKSFNLSLLHHLGDWNANLTMALSPYLPAGERAYKFNTEISFLVQWIPISEIKSEITYNKEKFEFK
ncbi:hypothetical protein AGMMS4952_06770 [Spirochaetia bacterium]|nr:hypothetical protein AGMMS4952_06770 [Spirochaetia bacterium]